MRRTVRSAGELGIRFLTIFSFSSENWLRPPAEVRELMGLLRRFIRNDLAELHHNDVRVRIIGERDGLDPEIRHLLEEAEALSAGLKRRPATGIRNYPPRADSFRLGARVAPLGTRRRPGSPR